MVFDFDAELWVWQARRTDTWTFVSLPTDVADEVLDVAGGVARGFGSLRVEVRLGDSRWRTSIFPDGTAKTYVLPIKKAVRHAEGVEAGDVVRVAITLLDV
ncbi:MULTISPECIES: DUF1905 domain-containing protein [unclassified Actinotalea]|uniref:DUF1905 domain-containing protein n=1 Tax=unclassified Actinotalea TaxID=2638618 RepID=UPI00210217AA|nr:MULTISPECIES: DUF1905 domain-containing protein [unclassified Actinotalea]